ncbi:MAG: DUF1015 family protein [Acidimicrobiaceae bacterium]
MKFVDTAGRARETVGVLGVLQIEEPNSKEVLPHEQTTPKAKTDRLEFGSSIRSAPITPTVSRARPAVSTNFMR